MSRRGKGAGTVAVERERQVFGRDRALPHLEVRAVDDARRVCYAPHSHATFSIGVVTGGVSDYRIRGMERSVGPGATVIIDPEETHVCNPRNNHPWSYRMLYVDARWMAGLDGGDGPYRGHGASLSLDPRLHRSLAALIDGQLRRTESTLAREGAAVDFLSGLSHALGEGPPPEDRPTSGLDRAADFITDHCADPLRLEDIRAISGLSLSHFLRAFKRRHGLSPHAYQLNRRVQRGQDLLRRGRPIVEVAQDLGFADQAHFQRVFKRLLAVTPGRYAAG
jgi:AraC-like DNA-binding protein